MYVHVLTFPLRSTDPFLPIQPKSKIDIGWARDSSFQLWSKSKLAVWWCGKSARLLLTRCPIAYHHSLQQDFEVSGFPPPPGLHDLSCESIHWAIRKSAFSYRQCSQKDNREIIITLLAIKSHNASLIYCRLEPKPDCAIPAVENIPLRSDGKWLSADTLRHNSGRAEK